MIRKKTVKEGKINFKKNKMDFTGVVTPTRIHIVTDLGGGESVKGKNNLKQKQTIITEKINKNIPQIN